jgi:hypothetical protein
MFSPAATTVQALVDERGPVDYGLTLLPRVERYGIDYGFSTPGLNLLGAVQNLGNAADRVLPLAIPGLRSASVLLKDTATPLSSTKQVFDAVPGAAPAALSILSSLKPDLSPLRGLFTNLDDPVTVLSEHGCDIQNFASGARSLVSWGTLPGTHYGPNSGFPFTAILGPQQANPFTNTGFVYSRHTAYNPPCYFTPAPTFDNTTILQTLSEVFH